MNNSNIEDLKSSHQQLIDQAAAVMLCIEGLIEKEVLVKTPKEGEGYWFIGGDGHTYETTYYTHWPSAIDKIATGNWFWTKEEAEKADLRIKVDLLLRKEAEKLNNNTHPMHYLFADGECMEVSSLVSTETAPDVLFSSREIALQAASNVGEDLIKKAWSRDND